MSDVLTEAFRAASISRVAVVDDCFDDPQIDFEIRDSFFQTLEHNELLDAFRADVSAPNLADADGLSWEIISRTRHFSEELKRKYAKALAYVVDALGRTNTELGGFLSLLSRCQVEPIPLGAGEKIPDDVRIVFLDYHLKDHDDHGEQATEIAGKLMTRTNKVPIVVMMSNNSATRTRAQEVRKGARFFGGLFHFVDKADLREEFSASVRLARILGTSDAAWLVHRVISALDSEFHRAVKEVHEEICSLNIFDYGFLEARSLQKDGHPLGEHLSWLFSSYLHSAVFERSLGSLWDKLNRESFDVGHSGTVTPSSLIFEMYRRAQYADVGPVGRHPRQADGSSPYVTFGDVLVRNSCCVDHGDQPARGCHVVAIVSPACDVSYSPEGGREFKPQLAVQMVPGVLKELHTFAAPPSGDEILLLLDDRHFVVSWKLKRMFSVPYANIETWATAHGFVRKHRLRPLYALGLQRRATSELTRVGVPVGPARTTQLSITVRTAWSERKEVLSSSAFLVVEKGENRQLEFADDLVIELRRFILKCLNDDPPADGKLCSKAQGCLDKSVETWLQAFKPRKAPKRGSKVDIEKFPIDLVFDPPEFVEMDWTMKGVARILVLPDV